MGGLKKKPMTKQKRKTNIRRKCRKLEKRKENLKEKKRYNLKYDRLNYEMDEEVIETSELTRIRKQSFEAKVKVKPSDCEIF